MEKIHVMHIVGTPMNPLPQQLFHKRLPPKILSLRYKVTLAKSPIDINNSKENKEICETNLEENARSPMLPIIQIKKNHTSTMNSNGFRYSKGLPKVHIYKPLFQGRNKSYIRAHDEDEEYISMKNRISLLDY